MPSLREHVQLKERPGVVKVHSENHRMQPQSSEVPKVSRKVGIAATVAVVATIAALALFASTTGNRKDQGAAFVHESMRSASNYPQPDVVIPAGKALNYGKVMAHAYYPALPSPLQVSTHARIDMERKIQELNERQRQRNMPDPNYEEVMVQLKNEPEHDSGTSLPSKRSKKLQPPNSPPSPDPRYVMEEITLQKHEEHDSRKHPKDVRTPDLPNPNPHVLVANEETEDHIYIKNMHGIKETKSNPGNNKKTRTMQKKESDRLPTRRLDNGTRVCETAECYEAASRIAQSLDRSTNPCDDFYQFACGGWIDKHPVPETGWAGTYIDAVERLNNDLLLILETPAEPDAPAPLHDIRTLYSSCVDTDTLDELSLDPLLDLLSGQGGWPMVEEAWNPDSFNLSTALNNLRSINVYPLVAVSVSLDIFNTSKWIIFVDAGQVPIGVSLMASVSEAVLTPYRTFMTTAAKMLRDHEGSAVTDQEIEDQVQGVIDFEIKFSKIVMKAVSETTDHAWSTTVTQLQQDTDAGTPDQFKWLDFLEEMFEETDITITNDEPLLSFKGPFFKDFSNMLATTDPRIIANALGWWWVYNLQQESTDAMRNASFTYLQEFYIISQPTPRWKHCLDITNANLGFALSREYVDRFLSTTAKPETTELVEDLRGAFSSLLDNNTWMIPEDLLVAHEKLGAIDPFVAYPEWIMDDEQLILGYEGLELKNGEHMKNLVHIGHWYNVNSLAVLRDVAEHTFPYPPTIVNAVYIPTQNSIAILGGILQTPFYAHNSLAALNYGGVGMIIGHEMTHGFDSIGRLYDKNGNMVQWWSNNTIAAFNKHALCFVNQYNKYIPPELSEIGLNISVNGIQTLAENIADNGGIREAFQAYQAYVHRYGEEPRLPGLEEFSPEHIFYLGFANAWCEHKSPKMVLELLAVDAHSPGRFRVLGPLSNDDEFSKVWNCPVGSPMNHGSDSCLLW